MKAYKKYMILLAVTSALSAACGKNFLNRPPEDQLTVDNFYATADQVKASTNALYDAPWFGFNTKAFWAISELSGGNARTYSGDVVNFGNFTVTADNQILSDAWTSLFSVVAQSNALINNLPARVPASVDKSLVNNALGEARLMRAVAYFYLVRLWGNVPIIENNLDYVYDPKIPVNPIADVYKFIIRDLQFAEANCFAKIRSGSSPDGHVSSGTASALLAKVYLYQQDYANARAEAEKVINSKEFGLYGIDVPGKTYADLFKTQNNNNEESIMALQWKVQGSTYGIGNAMQASFAINSTITGTGDGYSVIGPTIDLQKAYEPGDLRRKPTIMLAGDKYPEINSANGGFTVPDDVNAQNTKAGIKKYVVGTPADNNNIGAAQSTGINTYIMRYAELLLIEAEAVLGANASTNDPAALNAFNKVRIRAGLGSLPSITLDNILQERRVEMAIEGDYWYDLGRINRAKAKDIIANQERGTYSNDTPPQVYTQKIPIPDNKFLFPYPTSDVAKNPKLLEAPVPYNF